MLKEITFGLLLATVAGCDDLDFIRNRSGTNTESTTPGNSPDLTRSISLKWAVINKSKLQTVTNENFKKANPYSKEIEQNTEESSRDRSTLQQQVYELERTAQQKCITDAAKSVKDQQPQSTDNAVNKMSAYEYRNTPAFQECLTNIQKDQLIVDLKEKLKKLTSMFEARREHDDAIRKKANEAIESAVSKYAEKNGYQLIITNQSNDLVYNHDKMVLDVTDDMIDYILKTQIDTKLNNPQTVSK